MSPAGSSAYPTVRSRASNRPSFSRSLTRSARSIACSTAPGMLSTSAATATGTIDCKRPASGYVGAPTISGGAAKNPTSATSITVSCPSPSPYRAVQNTGTSATAP